MIHLSAYPDLTCRPVRPPGWRLAALLLGAMLLQACTGQFPLYKSPFEDEPQVTEPESAPETAPGESETAAVPWGGRDHWPLGTGDTLVGELATLKLRDGDTLPDIARHFGLGQDQVAIANPGLDPWAPEVGRRALLPSRFILPSAPRRGIVVNLAAMRLFYFRQGGVYTYPLGIGKEGRSTPTGDMFIARKTTHPTWYVPDSIRRDHARRGDPLPPSVPPGPDNPLGDYAMYLSRARYLVHGTNKPYSVGLRASNGCLRLYPEHIAALYRATPLKTPVRIVNQPYLLASHQGQPYLEAHPPHEELDAGALKRGLFAKLKAWEGQAGMALDWPKIEAVLAEALGIPVPIAAHSESVETLAQQAVAVEPPTRFYGRPPDPPLPARDAWHVEALDTDSGVEARRAAAILNHMGPLLAARSVALADGSYRVLLGPFKDAGTAQAAARRLWADMEIRGRVLPPEERLTLR